MKIGVSIKIDVTKIDKARLFQGQKGTYLDLSTFIDLDQQDQYGNNGFIAHSVSQEERAQGVKGDILGNVRVFYNDAQNAPQAPQAQPSPYSQNQAPQYQQAPQDDDFDQQIPF